MADQNELRARLAAVVREFLAEEGLLAAAGQGAPSRFEALEDAAVEVGDALTRALLEQELAAEAEVECHCPTCGAAGLRKKERQRSIQTRRGPVDVTEVECHCRPCRRSFFPQSQALGLQPDHDLSPVESTIKRINRRMKGSEKFWSVGAEALLTLSADHLSDTPTLAHFWRNRPHRLTGLRCYQQAA